MEKQKLPEFMALYNAWEQLSKGPKAELRRVGRPDELIEVPAFYRLFSGRATQEWEKLAYQRLIFCLPCIKHTDDNVGLGKALAKGKGVSEKRLFQVIRSDAPNDMIQLRRILQMVEPSANWPNTAKLLWYWSERSKRDLLEDYFINQPK
ncbi:MAG: type I-E CRISPR-associated protein Cse2/CasB [Desulfoprunum sp.]|nr:type I-E CRISPR-associated protein Cse2/CasB [Desulfoprunum sp.]